MNPYYERDGIVIYLGDCREVLPRLSPSSVDLIVTDPPYGVGWRSNFGQNFDRIAGDDDASWVPGAMDLAARALRPRRHAYIFGRFDLLPPYRGGAELIWDKCMMGSGDVTSPWGPSHEPIMFRVRAPDRGRANAGRGGVPARLRQGSVLSYPRPNATAVTRHPTEKPVPLLRRLIESSSLVGETILDPFLGSGSTLVAAIAEGRRGVGIELEERYAATAAERAEKALDAVRLAEPALT
jgi:DNA modification methylase